MRRRVLRLPRRGALRTSSRRPNARVTAREQALAAGHRDGSLSDGHAWSLEVRCPVACLSAVLSKEHFPLERASTPELFSSLCQHWPVLGDIAQPSNRVLETGSGVVAL